jgi:hypothetical protein
MEVVKTLGKGMVPRAEVEPARPFGQRILSPQHPSKANLTSRKITIFAQFAAIKVSAH